MFARCLLDRVNGVLGCGSLWRGVSHRVLLFHSARFLCLPSRAASLSCCTWRRWSISHAVFLCSVVSERLLPGFAWDNHPFLVVIHANENVAMDPWTYRYHISCSVGVPCITDKISEARLKWYGHSELCWRFVTHSSSPAIRPTERRRSLFSCFSTRNQFSLQDRRYERNSECIARCVYVTPRFCWLILTT